MPSPPISTERRNRGSLDRLLPERPRYRVLLAVVGSAVSLGVGTYGVNFMLGPLNLGVLEFLWGALLAVGGIVGLLVSVAMLVPILLATAKERLRDEETRTADDDPIASLKRRYAEGELDEQEFERRLERLLQRPDDDGRRHRSEPDESTASRETELGRDN